MSFVGLLLMWSALQHPGVTTAARGQQAAGYGHAWGASFGTAFNDEGRGVAVTIDGSVIHTSTSLNYTDESQNFPMAHVRKIVDGGVCWSLTYFVGAVGVDWVATWALALADAATEQVVSPEAPAIAYVAGLYRGDVNFGVTPSPPAAPPTNSSFVARVREAAVCPTGTAETTWVVSFRADDPAHANAALAIAAARPLAFQPGEGVSTSVAGKVVVGGYFTGNTQFGDFNPGAATGEDAYIVLMAPSSGTVDYVFALGGSGNQRITAVAVDDRTLDVFVAGWFDGAGTDFVLRRPQMPDPPPAPDIRISQGGRDLFVARYRFTGAAAELTPLWVHTFGTTGDDEASCVALGVNDDATLSTLAFVGGWTGGAATGRDLYFAAIQDGGSVKWMFNPTASGDDRVLGVAADGLGRPVFTGQFGCAYAPGTACPDPSIQFGSTPLSPNGLDAFVARFHPITGGVDWAYQVGGNLDESASAIAFDPASTGRFALTGWFGKPDAPPFAPFYTIDLDPGPGVSPVSSAGLADAFLSVLDPAEPQFVGHQVSLVLDQSGSMHGLGEFPEMIRALRQVVPDSSVVPWRGQGNPGGGTREWSVQMNAVLHSTIPRLGQRATVIMPWTVLDVTTAPLFARRLGATREHWRDVPGNHVGAGLRAATASLTRSGVNPSTTSTSASILLVDNELHPADDLAAARAEATAPGKFDRICVLFSGGGGTGQTREDALLAAVMPRPGPASPAEVIDRQSPGFAGYVASMHPDPPPSTAWPFRDLLRLGLTRLGWCVSDYDRNGFHQQNDLTLLSAHSDQCAQNPPPHPSCNPYSDWNFDGIFDGHLPGGIDRVKLSGHLPALCP